MGRSASPPPGKKDAPTWYYQSDGSGRDSYVLKNNGGLRPEYSSKTNDRIFRSTLRSENKSPLQDTRGDPLQAIANFDTYQNWHSMRSKAANDKNYKIQADLINRLTKGSPERQTRIDFIIGMDKRIGRVKKMSISSYQGAK